MWLYGAVRPIKVAIHVVNGWLAGQSIRLTPGRDNRWTPPIFLDSWLSEVEKVLSHSIGHAVVLLPRDRRRRRFSLLLLDDTGTPIAFAKFTMNPPNAMAIEALRRFAEDPPSAYWAPGHIASGVLDSYSYTVTSSMPNRHHWPAKLSPGLRQSIIGDIQTRLADLVSDSEVAVHGDFGAWNVRSLGDGSIAIVDWEEVGGGVSAADELWHVLSWIVTPGRGLDASRLIRREMPHHDPQVVSDAARYWIGKLSEAEPAEVNPLIARPPHVEQTAVGIRDILERLADRRL